MAKKASKSKKTGVKKKAKKALARKGVKRPVKGWDLARHETTSRGLA